MLNDESMKRLEEAGRLGVDVREGEFKRLDLQVRIDEAKQKAELAQKSAKDTSRAMLLVTAVYTIVSFLSWLAARDMNRTAVRNFAADRRPHVLVTPDSLVEDGDKTWSLYFRLFNALGACVDRMRVEATDLQPSAELRGRVLQCVCGVEHYPLAPGETEVCVVRGLVPPQGRAGSDSLFMHISVSLYEEEAGFATVDDHTLFVSAKCMRHNIVRGRSQLMHVCCSWGKLPTQVPHDAREEDLTRSGTDLARPVSLP